MGCATSSSIGLDPVVCPKNYDNVKFQKILTLFDKLDKDGNFCLDNTELDEISKLHIENLKKVTSMAIRENDINKNSEESQIKNKYNLDLKALENRMHEEIRLLNGTHKKKQIQLNRRLNAFDNISKEDRIDTFRLKIIDQNNKIVFWKFFEYMKERVHDIDNINLSVESNINKRVSFNNYTYDSMNIKTNLKTNFTCDESDESDDRA